MQQSLFDLLGSEYDHYKTKTSDDWYWNFKDYPSKNGLKVFSCFACGGGSTMGYKLAGYDVIGCLEIDKTMNDIYLANHHPKLNYVMDIRDFNQIPNKELPSELFDLDILDGSPPCTTFSMAGLREKTWGKKKKFREGQKEQTLDDLSFVYIETVNKLKPKFVVMENVEGLTKGNAWSYVQNIYKNFHSIGYKVKHWLLKGENMGVPQKRHRVFFIATRLNVDLEKLDMSFLFEPVVFKQIKSLEGTKAGITDNLLGLIKFAKFGDRNLENACLKTRGKSSFFNYCFVYDDEIAPTLTAHCNNIRWDRKEFLSKQDIVSMSTFPQNYDFKTDNTDKVAYICGMSVPPVMIKRVAEKIKPYLLEVKK
jgi:DNA (cytosine-5)-methyltransferase 1